MPRFYFDVHDGVHDIDHEGTELQDIADARKQAAQMAGRLLCDEADKFWSGHEWTIAVRDEKGLALFSLIFVAQDAAATGPKRPS
jgi:hypothetical protein